MTHPFRLQAILNLRQQERDQLAVAVTVARAELAVCLETQGQIGSARNELMDELRRLNESSGWSVGHVADRQSHLEQLRHEFEAASRTVIEAETQVNLRMVQLLKADQAFRGLERLAEKHAQAELTHSANRMISEMDDAAMSRWRRADV
ncbi:flagellar export protein FliJ [Schlesneria paludicola]|uniref:flagellar export protein FliJ n=1 Tax=Schlesneria paludicola TaxID=360056 RepID=UPI00029A29A3|nr:flagellar FliJ family protein [Schlesneria paludicola]